MEQKQEAKHEKEKISIKRRDYRRNSFGASKRRRVTGKTKTNVFDKKRQDGLKVLDAGSWYDQESLIQKFGTNEEPPSTSAKKINLNFCEDSSSDESENDDENFDESCKTWIIDLELMTEHLNDVSICKICHRENCFELVEKTNFRAGLATKFTFQCKYCSIQNGNDAGFFTSQKVGKFFSINRLSVLGARLIGKGYSGLRKFCSVLGLVEPLVKKSFKCHTDALHEQSEKVKERSIAAAGINARKVAIKSSDFDPKGTIDIPTCFDGSWSSRGWTARDGIASAIADSTGQVLDVIYKTSSCRECKKMEEDKQSQKISFADYLDLYVKHESKCLLNHVGSSSKMESDSVLTMYERSLKLHNIRYRPYIGDGDSSSYSNVEKSNPYGVIHPVAKAECVNHVTKRMGTGLRSLTRDYKGKKLADKKPLGGKGGGLTILKIDTIQNFYGQCIRRYKNDPETMSKRIWAILQHYSSTVEKPLHQNCPMEPDGWCSYNRDLLNGTHTHRPIKNPLREAVCDVMKPVFQRLADPAFLEGCKEGFTQNVNESFNHVVWGLAPKETHASSQETALAVNLAVGIYNNGFQQTCIEMLDSCDLEITGTMLQSWARIDKDRIYWSTYKATTKCKERRKAIKRAKCKKQDAFTRTESVHYQSERFYTN